MPSMTGLGPKLAYAGCYSADEGGTQQYDNRGPARRYHLEGGVHTQSPVLFGTNSGEGHLIVQGRVRGSPCCRACGLCGFACIELEQTCGI